METNLQKKGVWVVIPASGVGSRMQSETPKQYLLINGKSILEHTIGRFTSLSEVAGVLVVVSESDTHWDKLAADIYAQHNLEGVPVLSALGGSERSDTVAKGLSYLLDVKKINPKQWVMVHDAARPCVREIDILKLLSSRPGISQGGAILATPVRDTLKHADTNKNNTILRTQSRDALWQAQTPQLFRLGDLQASLDKAKQAGIPITDEASSMEYDNKPVLLIEGTSDNIKLTTPADLRIIDFLLNDNEKNNGS